MSIGKKQIMGLCMHFYGIQVRWILDNFNQINLALIGVLYMCEFEQHIYIAISLQIALTDQSMMLVQRKHSLMQLVSIISYEFKWPLCCRVISKRFILHSTADCIIRTPSQLIWEVFSHAVITKTIRSHRSTNDWLEATWSRWKYQSYEMAARANPDSLDWEADILITSLRRPTQMCLQCALNIACFNGV